MRKQFIEIKTDFEAIHNWPECPFNDVAFLKHPHRHKIYIKVKIETTKDRQLEFFRFKYYIDNIIDDLFGKERLKILGRKSMEEICNMILDAVLIEYKNSKIIISASEDNQVEGSVEYEC